MTDPTPPCENDDTLTCTATDVRWDGSPCNATDDLMFDMMSGEYRCPDHFPKEPEYAD